MTSQASRHPSPGRVPLQWRRPPNRCPADGWRVANRAALCAARIAEATALSPPKRVPWRERPPVLAARAAKPAASVVVAHATAAGRR